MWRHCSSDLLRPVLHPLLSTRVITISIIYGDAFIHLFKQFLSAGFSTLLI
jgi:hypothetical protein